jgi:hypothetical protein
VDLEAGASAVSARFTDGLWRADVPLPSGGDPVVLRAVATDDAGAQTEITRSYAHDLEPPQIAISQPAAGEVFATSSLTVSGTAADDRGVAQVLLRVGSGDPEPAEGTTSWSGRVYLDPGTHTVTATAVDVSGQRTEASVTVTVSRIVTLRAPNDSGDLTLSLDAAGLNRLVPEDDQKRLTLLYVDLEPLMLSGLEAIKNPLAAGLDTSAWGPAERNMQRLLRMSPDSANLTGTSLEPVLTLAPNIGLPPARLLADIAGVAVDEPFLSAGDVARAMLRNLIGTHPNIDTDPADGKKKVRNSLYDALRDFTTLGPRFGPTGSHPGFLTGGTFARALKANFKMTITAQSNLTQHDGVNPEKGKGYLFVLRDPSRPSILEFDFLNPDHFQVEGIADEPRIDMTFFMGEQNGFLVAGTDRTARPDGIFYRGSSAAWGVPPWLLEHLVIDAVYVAKRDRFASDNYQHTYRYDVGALAPAATVVWDKGWITMTTAGGLGSPPPPTYYWDCILEAAQKRLHDEGVAEGAARVQFKLSGIPLGLTGAELTGKLRPQMEAQKADLSRILLGDRSSYTSAVAFYRARGADGAAYLYFTAPGDIPGAAPYPYASPGFFRDQALTQKASSTAAGTSGDSVHEKVRAEPGSTYFIRGSDGKRYQVDVLDLVGPDLRVRVVAVDR